MDDQTDRTPSSNSDVELTSRLRAGEDIAVEAFVRDNAAWMLRAARRVLKDRATAEDAVQAAFVAIFKNLEQFRGEASLQGWMRRIVINEALSVLRKRDRLRETPIDDLLPVFDAGGCRIEDAWRVDDTPETLFASRQAADAVRAAIDDLPDIYRVILLLRDIEELSTAEVAEMLDLEEGNVKVRLHRARAALKTMIEPIIKREDLP